MTPVNMPPRIALACKLMLAVAGVGFIQFISALSDAVKLHANRATLLELAKDPRGMQSLINAIEEMLRTEMVLGILCVLGVGALVLAQRRSPYTRVWAWPIYALVACGNLWIMGYDNTTVEIGNVVGMEQAVHPTQEYVDHLNALLTPAWYVPVHYLTQTACIAGAIAIIALLAGPTVHEYFRARLPISDSHYLDTENLRRP